MLHAIGQPEQSSLSLQLLQAYQSAMFKAENEDSRNGSENAFLVGHEEEQEEDEDVNEKVISTAALAARAASASLDLNNADDISDEIGTRNFADFSGGLPISSSGDLGAYQVNRALEAWSQIRDIASEVAHSAMTKQAQIVCEVAKQDVSVSCMLAAENARFARNLSTNRSNKRRKVNKGIVVDSTLHTNESSSCTHRESPNNINGQVVSSDDDDTDPAASIGESAIATPSSPERCNLLSGEVERMGRMSNCILNIEHYHRLFQAEMEAMLVIEH